jgi:hypothetical protein
MFVAIGIYQARTLFLKGFQPCFPRAKHRDGMARLRQPRCKKGCKRARANDEDVFHLVNVSDSHLQTQMAVTLLLSNLFQ